MTYSTEVEKAVTERRFKSLSKDCVMNKCYTGKHFATNLKLFYNCTLEGLKAITILSMTLNKTS
jgi:hypothetical protein